ncbi:WD repeat-containing protein 74 [Teleopsis dalmanni]|uniref:WD repeat-containing protein 74 n=1 Tax=Teleopsis dalmanni TaxID=139649 RepID=UPI0018CF418D|nr:WD repeat-containing protein 74 [Teleopsis dalmanni]
MKWTTANVKNPNYTQNHEIFVGTHTGSFKKVMPTYQDNPFKQQNLRDLEKLDKDSVVTALAFGDADKSEILIGRAHNTVEIHSVQTGQLERAIQVKSAPVVGLARFGEVLIAGLGNGEVQHVLLDQENPKKFSINTGDDMAHLRQCLTYRNLVATGGKGRQNNLKIYDMAVDGKQIFSSKNLPNDYLQLEVPVWDCDVGFIASSHTLATCSRYGYVRVYDTRKQRRPVQCFATENQLSFTTLTAHDNYIYTGTTMGALKAFDIRNMKNFVHTYKGFTGGISDVCLDATGKYLASASLDRYVRVHHVDSCVLQYQCYIKSKAMRVLLRECTEEPSSVMTNDDVEGEKVPQNSLQKSNKRKRKEDQDDEYEAMFENMQTICENDDNDKVINPLNKANKVKSSTKRKTDLNAVKNKKKK